MNANRLTLVLLGLLLNVSIGRAASGAPPPPESGKRLPLRLTVSDAEALALKNNPQITIARLDALAAVQMTRETRSALFPTLTGDLTGVDADSGTRISAGGLNNPILYDRAAAGAIATELITDFGRTTSLVKSAAFRAGAENQHSIATTADIVLAVDRAFYNALEAGAVLRVARQTVEERDAVATQIKALTRSQLKSQLDLSFAEVNVKEADLLVLDAENNQKATLATLSAVLGSVDEPDIQLIEDPTPPGPPSGDLNGLISEAMSKRPEIAELDLEAKAAEQFHLSERDLVLPSIRALAAAGTAPYRNDHVSANYAAIGIDIEIPIFNGFLFGAREKEAELRAEAARSRLQALRDDVARDVRTGWLDADTAYSRLSVTRELLQEANTALDLARTRYKLGLSSIVELSQAQLQQTAALIRDAEAQYRYRYSDAVLRFETGRG